MEPENPSIGDAKQNYFLKMGRYMGAQVEMGRF